MSNALKAGLFGFASGYAGSEANRLDTADKERRAEALRLRVQEAQILKERSMVDYRARISAETAATERARLDAEASAQVTAMGGINPEGGYNLDAINPAYQHLITTPESYLTYAEKSAAENASLNKTLDAEGRAKETEAERNARELAEEEARKEEQREYDENQPKIFTAGGFAKTPKQIKDEAAANQGVINVDTPADIQDITNAVSKGVLASNPGELDEDTMSKLSYASVQNINTNPKAQTALRVLIRDAALGTFNTGLSNAPAEDVERLRANPLAAQRQLNANIDQTYNDVISKAEEAAEFIKQVRKDNPNSSIEEIAEVFYSKDRGAGKTFKGWLEFEGINPQTIMGFVERSMRKADEQ